MTWITEMSDEELVAALERCNGPYSVEPLHQIAQRERPEAYALWIASRRESD